MVLILILLLLAPYAASDDHKGSVDTAWSILETSFKDKNPDKRARAAHALGMLRDNRRAQEMAEKALSDENALVRMSAANALGKMNASESKDRLEQALKDNDVRVVVAAADALYAMNDPAAYDVYYELLTGERKSANSAVQRQLSMLKDRKQVEKLAIQTGLGFVPFGGMSYQAWQMLTHDNATAVRAAAAGKLARDPDPKTARALEKMCFDKSWEVRFAVVDTIADRGDPALQDSVHTLMWDDTDAVRLEAAAAVLKLDQLAQARTGSGKRGSSVHRRVQPTPR